MQAECCGWKESSRCPRIYRIDSPEQYILHYAGVVRMQYSAGPGEDVNTRRAMTNMGMPIPVIEPVSTACTVVEQGQV